MDQYLEKKTEIYEKLFIEKIKKWLRADWMKLRAKVHDIITKINEYNETN